VEKVESFPPGHEAEVLQLASSMDRLSNHPLARAIVRHARQCGAVAVEVEDFAQTSGAGISARYGGKRLRLGRRTWAQDLTQGDGLETPPPKDIGVSEVWLAAGDFSGRILLRDDIRPEARDLVEQLRRRGLKSLVLTGDHQAAADFLRVELGLDDVRGGLKPEEKLEVIQSLNGDGRRAAMIGDGVNDAPSLAAAHVGVAMGARGSDAALEQAAVVLMHDRLENFLAAYELSRRARTIIHQNLTISLGVIIVLVTLALLQQIPLTLGVLGHEGSTVVVVLNSLRLLFGRAPAGATK
jgi:Cd2+/Zn2+-exporting ATPase